MAITSTRRKRLHGAESAPAGRLFVRRLCIGGASPNSPPLSDSRQVLSAFGQIASSVKPAGDPADED